MTARSLAGLTTGVAYLWLVLGQACLAQSALKDAPPALSPVRLDQAVDTALDHNPAIKNSMLEVEISRDRIRAARTHSLPSIRVSAVGLQLLTPLNFDFNKGVFGDFPATGPIPEENTKVRTDQRPLLIINTAIAQPLSQLWRAKLAVRQLELSRVIAQQKLRVQRQQIANQTRRAYYKALELEDEGKVIEATKALYREVERITSEYVANKTVLPADAIEVRQQLANAEYESTKIKNALATQKEEINNLLGRDTRTVFQLSAVSEPAPLDMDLPSAQARALSARAEIKQLALQAKQIELQKRIKRSQYLPDLSVVVDYLSVFGAQVLPTNIVFAGLVCNWEPIDWGRKHWEIAEQHKMLKQNSNSQSDLEAQIILEVNASFRKFQESTQYLQVTQLGRELATERLRVATDKYREKANLLKDVLQSERELTQANNQYMQAVLGLWTARADLAKAMGDD